MKISTKGAMRCVLCWIWHSIITGEYISIKNIAQGRTFLKNIGADHHPAQSGGYVRSVRGAQGGYMLARILLNTQWA